MTADLPTQYNPPQEPRADLADGLDAVAQDSIMPFSQQELRILLITPGIGPEVVRRLEEAGLDSFSALRKMGIEATVAMICRQVGSIGWANRRRPLVRALEAAAQQRRDPG